MRNQSGAAKVVPFTPAASEQSAFHQLTTPLKLANLSAIIESSYDAIFSTDLQGNVLSWNPAAERIYGYAVEEIIGTNIDRVLPDDRKDEVREVVERIIAGDEVPSFETKRKRKDGREIDVYLTISPVRDSDGEIIGVSMIARDVTDRKAAEAALRRKQQELEDFFENAVIGLHWVGPDGRILWANRAEMESLGYSPDEYIGRHIAEFHADPDVIDDILQRLGRNEKLRGYEARMRCKDGNIRHVLINSSVYRENGKFIHTRCFTLDVTERKMAEEALRRTEKMAATGRLAATIAHEINNPLEAVTNLLFIVRRNLSDPNAAGFLDLADKELRRVAHIAKQTLGFFKDSSHPERIAVQELLDNVISIYHSKIEAREIRVVRRFEPAYVDGLEGELRQVASNLIVNAIEASDRGGTIKVRVRQNHCGVYVLVADHGTGIAPADRDRIFEPFFTTKKDTGTGLGLWVTQEIVRKHGGKIRFRTSREPGAAGTVFSVYLPASA